MRGPGESYSGVILNLGWWANDRGKVGSASLRRWSRDLTNKKIALSLARDSMRQGHDVIRIEGRNGAVIDK